jgi:uncharacterized surface protein with fasciclin (FAS1) repeats
MQTSIRILTAATAVVVGASTAALAENPMVGGAPMFPTKTIVENAINSKDHTTLVAAVKAAGLVETLQGDGPFTVFAPVNDAFAALPPGTVESLLQPAMKDTLVKVLASHVVAGDYDTTAIRGLLAAGGGRAVLTTVSGDRIALEMRGDDLYVIDETANGARVTIADVDQSNGEIHVIDKVLMPAS